MKTAANRNLLIGGSILLAVPFVAGILRKNYVQLPREAWAGLVVLAKIVAMIGIVVMLRSPGKDRHG